VRPSISTCPAQEPQRFLGTAPAAFGGLLHAVEVAVALQQPRQHGERVLTVPELARGLLALARAEQRTLGAQQILLGQGRPHLAQRRAGVDLLAELLVHVPHEPAELRVDLGLAQRLDRAGRDGLPDDRAARDRDRVGVRVRTAAGGECEPQEGGLGAHARRQLRRRADIEQANGSIPG
jgi:hypothetical protein